VDATDPLANQSFDSVDPAIKACASDLGDLLFNAMKQIYRDGYDPFIVGIVYNRGSWKATPAGDKLQIKSGFAAFSLTTEAKTLEHLHYDWIRQGFLDGFKAST
jgi:hypothetical protein